MCTAISFKTHEHYFGRNLDLEYHYREQVVVTPRRFAFSFRNAAPAEEHYAMIGMATVADDYPLYYEATNECGLSMAGLNFPENAVYRPYQQDKDNVAPFEMVPWILSQCCSVEQARDLLTRTNVTEEPFNSEYTVTPLHWMVADREHSIVVEPRGQGVVVWENPIGVLTNNPPFDYHLHNLSNYLNVTREEATNRFAQGIKIAAYSRGMGGIGLPGDLSSASRFVRAAFTKANAVCAETEDSSVSQFFHILSAVEQQRGCVKVGEEYEITLYSSCCNTDRGIYYFTTYDNRQITAVRLTAHDLEASITTAYDLPLQQAIRYLN